MPAIPLLRYALPSLLAVSLLPATAAQAGGVPPTSRDAGPEGVRDQSESHRLTATPLATRTVLTQSQTGGGRVLRAAILEGRWGVPVVAYDGTSGGLSADGTTLVLRREAESYPRRRTAFAIVDTERMAIRDTIRLHGEWRFDALSADGRHVQLIQEPQRFDSIRATLRTYDLANRRFVGEAEAMSGYPFTRATGPGARRHFTLYAGTPSPFIHVFDTVSRTSRKLDLPPRITKDRRLWALRLDVRRNRVAVRHGDRIVASAARRPRRASAGGGPPWLAVAVTITGLVLAAAATRRAQATSRRSRELR